MVIVIRAIEAPSLEIQNAQALSADPVGVTKPNAARFPSSGSGIYVDMDQHDANLDQGFKVDCQRVEPNDCF
ncbi:MAG: hypothetical protein JWM04_166 [Verrucomicrobiales bacterium]|nr:hypothetical protein [Verrucomicrobiales bacterium]